MGFDIKREQFAVHGTVDHPGRVQPVMAQGGDEGLGVSVAKGHMVDKARPFGDHPVVLAMFVFSDVSLMKPRRVNALRMNGGRRVTQVWRACQI